jgi:galactokinase
MTEFGALMNISHLSSKNDFENSCDEIDCLIECAKGLPGFLGGRIQGGGFGGSTINLVESNRLAEFESQLVDNYFLRTSLTSKTHVLIPGSGAFRGSL